jgi:hypothetical protein
MAFDSTHTMHGNIVRAKNCPGEELSGEEFSALLEKN